MVLSFGIKGWSVGESVLALVTEYAKVQKSRIQKGGI